MIIPWAVKNKLLSVRVENDSTTPFNLPSGAEMEAFIEAIPDPLFGQEFVIVAGRPNEFFLCDVRAKAANGEVLHARILPFN
jgi:hypothetical protein